MPVGDQFRDGMAHALRNSLDGMHRHQLHVAPVLIRTDAACEYIAAPASISPAIGMKHEHLALVAMEGSANQWNLQFGAYAINQFLGMKVVGAIGHRIMAAQQIHSIACIKESHFRLEPDPRLP